jgi:hypothetical protein
MKTLTAVVPDRTLGTSKLRAAIVQHEAGARLRLPSMPLTATLSQVDAGRSNDWRSAARS